MCCCLLDVCLSVCAVLCYVAYVMFLLCFGVVCHVCVFFYCVLRLDCALFCVVFSGVCGCCELCVCICVVRFVWRALRWCGTVCAFVIVYCGVPCVFAVLCYWCVIVHVCAFLACGDLSLRVRAFAFCVNVFV